MQTKDYKNGENGQLLEKTLRQEKCLLVFGAVWCPHCRAMKPVVDEVAAAHPELTLLRFDTDRTPLLAARFGVKSLPTVLLTEEGKEKGRLVGFQRRAALEALIGTDTAAHQRGQAELLR